MAPAGSNPSLWDNVPQAPRDPILGVDIAFREDTDPRKVNLGIGAYRTEAGEPYVLPIVRRVEQEMAADPTSNHEYLPVDGLAAFNKLSAKLILGENSEALSQDRVVTVQALSGTGALRVGFAFVHRFLSPTTQVYIPNPTWSNHKNIIRDAGLPSAKSYRYFDATTRGVDLEGMLADLSEAPPRSVVLLHGCAHNPTGADPSPGGWQQLRELMTSRQLIPFFDNAYQGFASGSLSTDAASVRLFVDAGTDLLIGQSFAKNMGLYGERVGALSFVCANRATVEPVRSQLKLVIRAMYSSPPLHGARIAAAVLGTEANFNEWEDELKGMSKRIKDMRIKLKAALDANEAPGTWDHIMDQIGMFSYTGLTSQQVTFMREKYHIYMSASGRISMGGLTNGTVQYVADAMKDAVVSVVKQD